MNRIAGRSRFVLILAAVLVLGLVIFSGEYLLQAALMCTGEAT